MAALSCVLVACSFDERTVFLEDDTLDDEPQAQGSLGGVPNAPAPVSPGGGENGTSPSALDVSGSAPGNTPGGAAAGLGNEPIAPACTPGALACVCLAGGGCNTGLACNGNVCTAPGCGNGQREGAEQCDDGNTIDTDTCTSICQTARCGDGFVQGIEVCDDGNALDTDSCTLACQNARCGDGFVQGTEVCDDGNLLNNDACTNTCEGPRCGDGFVQGIEECDDANAVDDDSCSNLCFSSFNTIFVTSTTYTIPTLGGVAGADALCQERAAASGLSGNFVAWISDGSSSVLSRLGAARGWLRPDGLPFADSIETNAVYYPPSVTELGTTVDDVTVALGGYPRDTEGGCSDWTVTAPDQFFMSGDPTGGFGAWNGSFGSLACNGNFRLYCLQRDFSSRLSVTPIAGRRAFVTDSLWTVGGGLAAADAECMSNAQNAGLTGTFRALMATSTASPASRFSTAGAPWVRLDGIPLVAAAADLFAANGRLIAPLQVTPQGFYLGNEGAWTGSANPLTPGTDASTCSDWTTGTGTGTMGGVLFSMAPKVYSHFGNQPCSSIPVHLYCLEP